MCIILCIIVYLTTIDGCPAMFSIFKEIYTMESNSGRVLRQRNVVEYFPKPQFYNLVVEARSTQRARRRSKSVGERQPKVRRDSVVPPEANNYLEQANAMQTNKLFE